MVSERFHAGPSPTWSSVLTSTTNDRSYQVFPAVIVTTRALPLIVSDRVGLNLAAVQAIAPRP